MNTINVVEINGDDGLISSLRSFNNDNQGRQDAENLFKVIVKETTNLSEAGILVAIDNGYADVPGGGTVQLVTSE